MVREQAKSNLAAEAIVVSPPLLEKISAQLWRYRRAVALGVIVLLLASGMGGFLFFQHTHTQRTESLEAERLFQQFEKAEQIEAADFENLLRIVSRHPSLQMRYAGTLAQMLIARGRLEEAQRFMQESLPVTEASATSLDALLGAYTKTSLLISEGQLEAALQRTQLLQNSLQDRVGSLLYGFNLLRLAALYQQLGCFKEELGSLQELQRYLFEEKARPPEQNSGKRLVQAFPMRHVDLEQYIAARIQTIQSSQGIK